MPRSCPYLAALVLRWLVLTGIFFARAAAAESGDYNVLFLMSDESAYVNAQILAVDGGVTGIS